MAKPKAVPTPRRPPIRTVVIADDVRREDNGKLLIVGSYLGSILVDAYPTVTLLRLWLHTEKREQGEEKFEIRGILENSETVVFAAHATIKGAPDMEDWGSIVSPHIPIPLEADGKLLVQARCPESEWSTITTLRIGLKSAKPNPAADAAA